jgi:hypothetical protein
MPWSVSFKLNLKGPLCTPPFKLVFIAALLATQAGDPSRELPVAAAPPDASCRSLRSVRRRPLPAGPALGGRGQPPGACQ